MNTNLKYIQVLFIVIILASCSRDIEVQETTVVQPNSFKLSMDSTNEFADQIKAIDTIGINGETFPVLYDGLVSLYDVPVAKDYLIYSSEGEFSENYTLSYRLPQVQKYIKDRIDPVAYPFYYRTDNEGLDSMTVNVNPISGGLNLQIPPNESVDFITSVSLESETDQLTGELQINSETGEIILIDNKDLNKLALEGDIDISSGANINMTLPPMTFNGSLDVNFKTSKGTGTTTIDLTDKNIKSGKLLKVELEDIEWLSKTDYYGKANSVLVKPGETSVTVDCTPYYTTSELYTYENHPNDDKDKLPRSAKMLWNDVSPEYIDNVTLAEDGKSFTVEFDGQPGNALIAIYDKEDPNTEDASILWSFHIWVTDANEISLGTNGKGNTYTILDRNLGAVSTIPGDWHAIGMLYQWGRKDPFVSTDNIGKNSNVTMYNHNGIIDFVSVSGGEKTGTIEYAVENPMQFIRFSQSGSDTGSKPFRYAHDWLYHADDALWGNPEGYNFPKFSTLEKSIYDPSPEGYMVSPPDVWLKDENGTDKTASIFADAEWDNTNMGYKFSHDEKEEWFAIGGWRSRSNGNLTSADNGYYWNSTVVDEINSNAWYMGLNANSVVLDGKNSRANASSIRCVKISN